MATQDSDSKAEADQDKTTTASSSGDGEQRGIAKGGDLGTTLFGVGVLALMALNGVLGYWSGLDKVGSGDTAAAGGYLAGSICAPMVMPLLFYAIAAFWKANQTVPRFVRLLFWFHVLLTVCALSERARQSGERSGSTSPAMELEMLYSRRAATDAHPGSRTMNPSADGPHRDGVTLRFVS